MVSPSIKNVVVLLLLAVYVHCSAQGPLPNIVVILMDDQDWVLGGMVIGCQFLYWLTKYSCWFPIQQEPMAKTNKFVKQRNGTVFNNAVTTTYSYIKPSDLFSSVSCCA